MNEEEKSINLIIDSMINRVIKIENKETIYTDIETINNFEELEVNKDQKKIKIQHENFSDYSNYNNPLNTYYSKKFTTFKLFRKQIKEWIGPIVYICWQYNNKLKTTRYKMAFYVGMSKLGTSRPFHKTHQRKDTIENCDEVEILTCGSREEAVKLEMELIKFLRPFYNIAGKSGPPIIVSEIIPEYWKKKI